MLNAILVGHIGADAELKSSNGNEFVTLRVANTDKWTSGDGQTHETTTWVDCVISGKPKVFEYLKKGQLVYISGSVTLRVYSSAKDRCMKAGMTVNVQRIELLGGKSDDVPSVLYTEDGQVEVKTRKCFAGEPNIDANGRPHARVLVSKSGVRFGQDEMGWITPIQNES